MENQMDIKKRLLTEVTAGNLKEVRELINSLGLPYFQSWPGGCKMLVCALLYKHSAVAELLLKMDCQVNTKDTYITTPLHVAVENGDIEIVKMLLEKNANLNSRNCGGETEMLRTLCLKHYFELFLDHESDIIAYGESKVFIPKLENSAPLHIAVAKGFEEIVTLLLNSGAYVDIKNASHTTPLHLALERGNLKIVEVLLSHDADIYTINNEGRTVLHYIAKLQHGKRIYDIDIEKIAKLLLEKGANLINLDAKMSYGLTALHFAAGRGNIPVVEALLDYGADINITCDDNFTASDYCYVYNIKAAAILKRHVVKMKAANFYINKKNVVLLRGPNLKAFQDECEKEIEAMKCESIDNVNISLYNIFKKDTISLAKYMRNENIYINVAHFLKKEDYKAKYPIYAAMIKSRLNRSMKRKELEECNTILDDLLPYCCNETIFEYLNNADLRVLINASDPDNINNDVMLNENIC